MKWKRKYLHHITKWKTIAMLIYLRAWDQVAMEGRWILKIGIMEEAMIIIRWWLQLIAVESSNQESLINKIVSDKV
jgi:hypothetical protein